MAVEDKLTEDFIEALKIAQERFNKLLFNRHSFFEKGLAYFIEYRKENNTRVEFLFGPPEWNIEMIIYTSKGKFAFKDLLNIAEVNKWVSENTCKLKGRNMKYELFWFIDLLDISLPVIE